MSGYGFAQFAKKLNQINREFSKGIKNARKHKHLYKNSDLKELKFNTFTEESKTQLRAELEEARKIGIRKKLIVMMVALTTSYLVIWGFISFIRMFFGF